MSGGRESISAGTATVSVALTFNRNNRPAVVKSGRDARGPRAALIIVPRGPVEGKGGGRFKIEHQAIEHLRTDSK
jgi:hypothetical protein